jgi:hypothetical protein
MKYRVPCHYHLPGRYDLKDFQMLISQQFNTSIVLRADLIQNKCKWKLYFYRLSPKY